MRPKDLQLGTVSARTQRRAFLLLLLLTVLPRLHVWWKVPHPASQSELQLVEFLTDARWDWAGSPLALLLHALDNTFLGGVVFGPLVAVVSASVVLLLVRAGRRWLDLSTGIVAAVLWGITALAIAPPTAAAPAVLAGAGGLYYARQLLRFAAGREVRGALSLGLTLGGLAWLTGLAWLWLVGTLAWLPSLSQHFRGWAWLKLAGLVVGGTLLVVAPIGVRNLLVDGDFRLPSTQVPAHVLAAAHAETVGQPFPEVAANYHSPGLEAWTESQLADARLTGESASAFEEGAALSTLVLRRWGEAPAAVLKTAARRAIAFLAGWPGADRMDLAGLPTVPWAVAALLAWLGLAALWPSGRVFFPLFLGVLLPTVQAVAYGIDASTILLALPFFCLFAGYGLMRLTEGRRWISTWVLSLAVLSIAVLAHRWAASWV